MKYFDICITFIFIVKIIFLILAVYLAYLKRTAPNSTNEKNVEALKEMIEFIFIVTMSILVIYLFNPRYKRDSKLDYETKFLLFAFGFVSILGAKWSHFAQQLEYIKQYLVKSKK